jgi:flagellar assembly protein FliH
MSSKILTQAAASAIAPMMWRQAKDEPERQTGQTVGFQPARNVATAEVAELLSRIAELEHASRIEKAEAHRSGVAEGEARARTAGEAALHPVLDRMAQTTRELCGMRSRLRREAESDVVQLAIAIARRIIHRELSVDPAAMQALVQVALGRLDRQEIHRVWVHPSQAAAVKTKLAGDNPQVEVIADANRELGSLLFETNRGKLDASVNAQFEEIERGLTDRVNQR